MTGGVLGKFGGVLVNPSSTPGKEGLGKAFWAQLLAGLGIWSSTWRRGSAVVTHYGGRISLCILVIVI